MKHILLLFPFVFLSSAFAAEPTLDKVKAEIRELIKPAKRKELEKHLAKEFKGSFGGETKSDKDEFLNKVSKLGDYQKTFLKILNGKCGVDESGVDICPLAWTKCKEDDVDCGSQMRLYINRKTSPWVIEYYIGGD